MIILLDNVWYSNALVFLFFCQVFRALYDFTKRNANEISLVTHQIIHVHRKYDEQGNTEWWYCESNEGFGYAPANYLTPHSWKKRWMFECDHFQLAWFLHCCFHVRSRWTYDLPKYSLNLNFISTNCLWESSYFINGMHVMLSSSSWNFIWVMLILRIYC